MKYVKQPIIHVRCYLLKIAMITTRLTVNTTGRKDDLDLRPVCIQELGDAIDIIIKQQR